MDVGFGLISCQRYPGDPRSDEQLYHEALSLSEEAERLGFDSVWLTEHHFVDDSYMPSLLPVAAAIAARTERIRIGTGLLLAPLYEPVRLAEDAATVDLLSGGRLVLGLGQGWRAEEFEALRVPLIGRHRRLEDTVATLRQAWTGELVTGGEVTSYPGVAVTPAPAQPGGPPIWIGAMEEPAIRRTGRIADGFIAAEVTPESYAMQVGWAREELERAGRLREEFTSALYVPTFAWEEPDAWERVASHYHYVTWKYEDMAEARDRRPPPSAPPGIGEREAALRASMIVGDPEEVSARIRQFDEAAGGGVHCIAQLYWPGLDPGVQREALAVFGERVIPALRN